MSTFTKLIYHVVFSTKYRRKLIFGSFGERLYEYIGGVIRAQNGRLIEIGGVEDHVHLLVNLPPTKSISDTIREIKANASKWSNELPDTTYRFEWQKGYGAFTVSYSQVDSVRHYIRNQREHHRTKTFEEEYTLFLERHNIEFDRQYLFEAEHYG
jgi:REP-associated tyrosine transposase